MKNQKSGAILPLVCLLFLALSFIFCALLHSTRVLMPRVTYYEKCLQEQYDAESAILLSLFRVPASQSKKHYPIVILDTLGPWLVLKSKAGEREVKAFAGFYSSVKTPPFSRLELEQAETRCMLFYQEQWRKESYIDTLFGTTHYYKPQIKDFPGVLYVAAGDLSISLQGERFSKVAFYVEGDVLIEGEGILDSLSLYATGVISLSGQIKIYDANLYARGIINISDQIEARGVFFSEDSVVLPFSKSVGLPFWSNSRDDIENKDSTFYAVDLAHENPLRIFSWSVE
ncbi:MAG TPA: hypothetical protein PLT31_00190 [Fibrobacteraceae bacterium]|jgi:hypothetical protein|nr:hypothetical protein [Fibrobacter sp.]HOG68423.1 hypothetical protein [Fibrobacteraceae bacterium]HPW93581.1 hypothetical protein [Fibrobacteraceae bacterium]